MNLRPVVVPLVVVTVSVSSCATQSRSWTQDLPGQRYGEPPKPPVQTMFRPDLQQERFEREAQAQAEKRKLEAAQADAAKLADAEKAKRERIANAKLAHLCRQTDTDERCLAAADRGDKIGEACELRAMLKTELAEVRRLYSSGKRFGVIDLAEVDEQKGLIEAHEDALKDVQMSIGRSVTDKDCR